MLNKDLMPSNREFMIAALAASSVVGASGRGLDDRSIGIGVDDLDPGSSESTFPAAGVEDLADVKGAGIEEIALTGSMTTFLNDERKSCFAACLLTFDM